MRTDLRQHRIKTHNRIVLYLLSRRRGERRRTHDGPVHRTGHTLFRKDSCFFCFREIGQDTHRPAHLTEDERNYQCNELQRNSTKYGLNLP